MTYFIDFVTKSLGPVVRYVLSLEVLFPWFVSLGLLVRSDEGPLSKVRRHVPSLQVCLESKNDLTSLT